MTSYPNKIYAPRAKTNEAGVVYQPAEKTRIFAEDVVKLDNEVVAVQNALGINLSRVFQIGGQVFGSKGIIGPSDNQDLGIVTNNIERVTILKDGNVGIGTTEPETILDISSLHNVLPAGNPTIRLIGQDNKERFEIRSTLGGPFFQGRMGSGTLAAPGAALDGTFLFGLTAGGHDGTSWIAPSSAVIGIKAAGTWSPTNRGSDIILEQTRRDSISRFVSMIIRNDGNVGIGTSTPNANALLDITSTTKAFMPPRMTTAQRDAIPGPTPGMIIFNLTTNKLNVRGGTAWEEITSA